ncbi:ribonuclease E [Microbacterium sp. oral taxon 186 str. F0373]|uniref:Rne/Rng family ribonuclease n=1 Tax=Microbacterium sp. oral taxon 186 TaxID=712383 RepID=UPI00034E82A6|nr:Rne/Rng family ribonuclease [Microbacterium sp. oral taxon 186]EPD83227.1 ribonuclease E [Microbacterium sp. oral taxon 186 str. F0373]
MADENNDQSTIPADEVLTPSLPSVEEAGAPTDVDTIDADAGTRDASAEDAPVIDGAPVAEEHSGEAEAADAEGTEADGTASDTTAPDAAEPDATEAEATEPEATEPVTAVSLGLLPAEFVSAVSTQLVFYAPQIVPLPARPGIRVDQRDDRDEGPSESGTSARRRNRRRGAGSSAAEDDAPREQSQPRRRAVELITEPQRIKGSTRLEAKKQRRRDGREAGRRRTVVTEAEFLARREAVDRDMIVRSKNGRIQIAVLEDNVLVEHYVARSQESSLIGNVYLGRVQNVLPSMEAAFVDIGRGRNAVLYSGEVDWDAVETGNQPRRIELALKSGDRVLVQVTKDPVGHKGARLTSQISLPGRYLVYVPGGAMNGISRKLPDTERARLKRILKEVLPESSGVIVRTAAEGATEDQLTRDVQRLTAQWEHISSQVEKIGAPALLHSEPDLLVKIVRDVFNEDFSKMLIQGEDAYQTITAYLAGVAPDLLERVEKYEDDQDPFDRFRVTEQIEKALDRKVWLPSGGSLVIDRTEAMTVVDVNTGKFVGSGGNLEETVTKNNLEAAEEIVRQLRLRDIGGIIVVDFIDMVLESNRDLVLRRLVECLSRDRTKHQVAEVTSLGLVQMTRKKLGLGLLETFSEACEVCAGRGVIVHHDPVVKHRGAQAPASTGGRRSRQSSSPAAAGGNGSVSGGTHVITESAKSALAQIAASTIHTAAEDAPEAAEAPAVTLIDAQPEAAPERAKRPRKKREPASRSSANERSEKEILLDSVLSALPEPKAPGQGRGRRRVTTAALTGTPVAATPTAEPAAE